MNHLFSSCVIAFSTYSRIPMPQVDWNEKNMKHTLAFFPLVGAAVGAAFWGADALCRLLDLGAMAASMTGSGPSVFGIFRDEGPARAAAEVLGEQFPQTFFCRPAEKNV